MVSEHLNFWFSVYESSCLQLKELQSQGISKWVIFLTEFLGTLSWESDPGLF